MPDNILDQKFDVNKIDEVFESVKKKEKKSIMCTHEYNIYGAGGFVGDVGFSDNHIAYYFLDNFPGPKVYRSSNIRIRTYRDFLTDLERVGFKDIKVKEVDHA